MEIMLGFHDTVSEVIFYMKNSDYRSCVTYYQGMYIFCHYIPIEMAIIYNARSHSRGVAISIMFTVCRFFGLEFWMR